MMRLFVLSFTVFIVGILLLLFVLVRPGFTLGGGLISTLFPSLFPKCPMNMVPVGNICVDEFEASVWSKPPNKLTSKPQGIPYGASIDNYPCSDNGNDCSDASQPTKMIFAVSAPGVTPSRIITWFQAQQACANVGKRLLRNGEWQMAAAGTPTDYEPGNLDNGTTDCNAILAGTVVNTGSRSNCVSNWGVYDMVGNLSEWVEDWIQDNEDNDGGSISTALYGLDRISGVDEANLETDRFPAALNRGGNYLPPNFDLSGVFALDASTAPSNSFATLGFRCAK